LLPGSGAFAPCPTGLGSVSLCFRIDLVHHFEIVVDWMRAVSGNSDKVHTMIKSLLKSLPPIKRLLAEREELRLERDRLMREFSRLNPGHYYSPIPSLDDLRRDGTRIFDRSLRDLPGVNLNAESQLQLLDQLKPFYNEQPFTDDPAPQRRYFFRNDFFSYGDALFLYGVMRWGRPQKIIEIGSGFSSFVMLDTNELFFNNRIRFTFIEPDVERLRSRLRDRDLRTAEIVAKPVQDVDLEQFASLNAGDILFVDSSHVAKIGSDVNQILFEILPRLRNGVLVHFHDVFYPFEYPREWIELQHRYWNEDYLLRAFLQYNSAFRICIWNHFLGTIHPQKLAECMPLTIKNIGGSLWLERI
jgi:hypothetical protein